MKTVLRSATVALVALAVCAPAAGAQVVKCQRAIAKASSGFLQARVKALQKCKQDLANGAIAGPCPDPKAAASIAKARGKLDAAIGKSCGGEDRLCGGDNVGEVSPLAVGWPATCPNFEKGDCNAPIADCGGIADCVACIAGAASDQAMKLYYDDLLPNGGNRALAKCQLTIGKATSKFLNAKTKILQKCWDARVQGTHGNACPSPGDGKAAAAIQKVKDKTSAAICKACGGSDGICGGGDDIAPTSIGFPTDCPLVTPPGEPTCAAPITDLGSLVACVDCVTEFKADCATRLEVPQYGAYPAECNACPAAPATGACPTLLTFTANGPAVDLDTGFTGLAHDAHVPTNGRITLAVSNCEGTNQPTCGECDVSGPLVNSGGPEFDTQRCRDAQWIRCAADGDCASATACFGGSNLGALCTTASECPGGTCSNAGSVGPCVFYFGAPLPVVAGGVPTCIVNEINGAITGTIDLNDGSSETHVPLISTVFPVGSEFDPCPHCGGGTCQGNTPRNGQRCVVTGTSLYANGQTQFGPVSLDCPPNPGSSAGAITIDLNLATGTQTKTVEAANPPCRQTGYNGLKCLCDTCNDAVGEGCSTNVDCPISSGGPGICGGLRCIGGTESGQPCRTCIGGANHGALCTGPSVCPGGTCVNPRVCSGGANCNVTSACPGGICGDCSGGGACARPGEPTQPNSCVDDSATPQMEGCIDAGNNEGECALGPFEQVCSRQTFHPCGINADCDPIVTGNSNLLSGQSCISLARSCFVDNGVIGNSIVVAGAPDAPCGGVSKPTVGAFFCVAPTSRTAINSAGGLPALGRVRIPGIVSVNP